MDGKVGIGMEMRDEYPREIFQRHVLIDDPTRNAEAAIDYHALPAEGKQRGGGHGGAGTNHRAAFGTQEGYEIAHNAVRPALKAVRITCTSAEVRIKGGDRTILGPETRIIAPAS